MQITKTYHINRLYYDCGWKDIASYKCNICGDRNEVDRKENESYSIAKPGIIQHIINQHPEYCYKCSEDCGKLYCTKGEAKKCKH